MKKHLIYIVVGVLAITVAILAVLYLQETRNTENTIVNNLETVDESDYVYMNDYYTSLPQEELSQTEEDGLLLMREEEKLAHDVYTKLYEQWGEKIFSNISDSEQTHTDMVKELLDKYELSDPSQGKSIGEFEDPNMLNLYTQLVDQGSTSVIEALKVGALIEDLDIQDLEDLMIASDNEDILTVYQNLQKGSRNHLRSFTRVLNRNGETYTPEYISQELYEEIINTPSENGVTYDSEGKEIN
jgi:hypothetical protein